MKKIVCIHAGNIHGGGAIGVASSLIRELMSIQIAGECDWIENLWIVASDKVAFELINYDEPIPMRSSGITLTKNSGRLLSADRVDVTYTVFGPQFDYQFGNLQIAGFGDGSIVEPPPDTYEINSVGVNIVKRVRSTIKLKALKRYEQIVVETEHLKSRLERNGFASTPIWVIPNVPNIDAVREPNQESHVSLPRREDGEIRLFYPARGYPHKNHRIIGALAEEYLQRTGQTLKVIVTLRDDEVRALNLGPELTRSLINVGEISLRQCAYVYRNADGVLFPSLNETSSATPLEARSLGLPLIASDRSFVTQAVGEYGVLFDPLSPVSGAQAVAQVFSKDICKKLSSGVYTYKEIWTERMRAEALLKVLKVATGLG